MVTDELKEKFTLSSNGKFKTHVDVRLRVRYYLISYLRRMAMKNYNPTFDEIVLYILPLLKNGTTPESQTILNILKDIGEHVGEDKWRLQKDDQQDLSF